MERSRRDEADRAVALLRTLSAGKTREPGIAWPLERLLARLIDWVLVGVAFVTLEFVFLAAFGERVRNPNGVVEFRADAQAQWAAAGLACLLAVAHEIAGVHVFGRTLGKHVLGLRVTGSAGTPPRWRQSAVRAACFLPTALGQWLWAVTFLNPWGLAAMAAAAIAGAPLALFFVRDDRRGMQDLASGTSVTSSR